MGIRMTIPVIRAVEVWADFVFIPRSLRITIHDWVMEICLGHILVIDSVCPH